MPAPKPGQYWRSTRDGRTVEIEDTDGRGNAYVRDVETGAASVVDVYAFNRPGWTLVDETGTR